MFFNSIWEVNRGTRGGGGGGGDSNKKSVLSFMTSCKAVMPLTEEICTSAPRAFRLLDPEAREGRGEERGRIRCSHHEGKKIFPQHFSVFQPQCP